MATSAIGPGFLNNTALFTHDLLASFGFIILISILLDIGAQVNLWRIVTVSGMRAQDLGNAYVPGLGYALSAMVAFGGLAFNIGNVAGCGLGLDVLAGLDARWGAALSAGVAILLFWLRDAGRAVDWFVRILGIAMIGLTVYVAIRAQPPVGEALFRTFWPEEVDAMKIVALVGGTVGGYISFAGAHRLLDAGIRGKTQLPRVTRSSVTGILLTSLMRYTLFLAALGVFWAGTQLDLKNPAASVFRSGSGEIGYRFFGIVMWSAAITSVVGASYTSISFLKTFLPAFERSEKWLITAFIALSTVLFISLRQTPSAVLVAAGAVNGIILPFALALMLLAVRKQRLFPGYRHPAWLTATGWAVVLLMAWLSVVTVIG